MAMRRTANTDGDATDYETDLTYAALAATVTSGADEPVTFAINTLVSGAVQDIDGNTMTPKGSAMTWNVNGSVVEAKAADGRLIFTITQTTQRPDRRRLHRRSQGPARPSQRQRRH
ncbi:hypothetical protein EKN06_00760 [Croceicoccus ponticola]|uniref:Uncharacterized protein n=1 Tax=Croceicoccus ponticola TaxID=2217664 RepID=A0A437GZJ3_9SPHN|nr:hypothetical protein [Croceicoccus ponticola]RVQ68794.1 hypothetical protein EKN06_00760 [Croceicoccus ponticola]